MLKANRITWIWLAVCLLLLVIFFVFLFANIGNQEVSGALLKPALLGFVGLCAMLAWLTGGYVVDPVAEQHAAAQADAPACPECGQPLRSAAARQCFNCGADWHDRLPDAE